MKQFRNKRKIISLTIVTIAYALIVTPLVISNFQKQHSLHPQVEAAQTSHAAVYPTNMSVQSTAPECVPDGTAALGVLYTNASSKPVSVVVADQQSGHFITLGQIMPKETKIGTILTRKSAINDGVVTFSITSQQTNQTIQKVISYLSISCL